jgi:hypothetical protein
MIKGIAPMGKYTVVSAGNTSVPYVNPNINNPIQGMIRISGTDMQVYDGTTWMTMNTSYASVGLSSDAEALLDWARKKRNEEFELEALAQTNPTIRDLLDTIKQKEEQITIVRTLIKQEVGESGVSIPYGPA